MEYIVNMREVHIQPVKVIAYSEKAIKGKVKEWYGEYIDDIIEYRHILITKF